MERLIYTYALIRSLYDQGEDYIDSFWPFVIKVLPPNKFADRDTIQRNLKEKFDIEMPLHVLRTVLNRAIRRGYVEQKENEYKLTKRGFEYLDKLETDREVERRITALLKDMEQFFKEHEVPLSLDQIRNLLLSFLHKNIIPFIEFINPSAASNELSIFKPNGYEEILIKYIKSAEQHKPENYKTLQDMVLGSIISVILYTEEQSEMIEISTRKFKHCQVFLDTNYTFFLLDLYEPEFNEPAKELFDLLKKYKFDIKVFDFTVDEICRVIGRYPREAYRYPNTIRVDNLYSSLKRKGWTKTDAQEFIMNIENILNEKGIKIEQTGVNIGTYNPTNEELRNLMRKYKPLQDLFHQNHDIAAIEKIKELRRKTARKIEDSKAFFLTSDIKLSRFNFIEMGHKDNGTVCEVILDRLLANILWLKDPSSKPPFKAIIAAYSRDLFIKRRVWDRFCEVLKQLRKDGKVNDESISTLFYHNYIEDVLRELNETEVDSITPEFILEKVEEAAKFKEKDIERKIKEKEKEFLQRLREEVSKKEQEKEAEWSERLQKIKSSLRESAEKKANRDSIIYASILIMFVVGVMYGFYLLCEKIGALEFLDIIFPLFIGSGGGIWVIWAKFRRWLKNKLSNRIYTQRLKEVKLDEEM